MADPTTHIAVASLVKKHLGEKVTDEYLLGSLAPDIRTGLENSLERRIKTHFQIKDDDQPILSNFLLKYEACLEDDFVLGYYVHLATDYYWYMQFLPKFCNNTPIHKLSVSDKKKLNKMVYHDYLCINSKIKPASEILSRLVSSKKNLCSLITEINGLNFTEYLEFLKSLTESITNDSGLIFDFKIINDFIDNCSNEIVKNIIDLKGIDKY